MVDVEEGVERLDEMVEHAARFVSLAADSEKVVYDGEVFQTADLFLGEEDIVERAYESWSGYIEARDEFDRFLSEWEDVLDTVREEHGEGSQGYIKIKQRYNSLVEKYERIQSDLRDVKLQLSGGSVVGPYERVDDDLSVEDIPEEANEEVSRYARKAK